MPGPSAIFCGVLSPGVQALIALSPKGTMTKRRPAESH
jgi:hypothetical protein